MWVKNEDFENMLGKIFERLPWLVLGLQIGLVVLKFFGEISSPWWVVLSPLILTSVLFVVMLAAMYIYVWLVEDDEYFTEHGEDDDKN